MSESLFDAYAITDRGLRRQKNEDAFICRPETGLFLVADGMGGESSGEVASRITTGDFEKLITPFLLDDEATIPFEHASDADPFLKVVEHAVDQTNRSVLHSAKGNAAYRGMGSTLTAAIAHGNDLVIAHVGDSRLYRFKDGSPEQITEDQTRVQELIRKNILSPEEARTHRDRHIITQCIGRKKRIHPDIFGIDLDSDGLYMLCSDGLYDMLTDEEIGSIVTENPTLESDGKQLVAAANAAGGRDNITVVLFRQLEKQE